ncbi:hypothetical protein GCM10028806_60240 [Spirosoma terrae]
MLSGTIFVYYSELKAKRNRYFMKKLLILGATLATLSLGSCARKANCPAYGSVHKPAPTQQAKV